MADRGRDRQAVRNVGDSRVRDTQRPVNPDTSGHSQPVDAGRTSGGGSLGHVQPDRVEREAPLRNNAAKRESDEPTMPSDDATLRTEI